MECSSLGAVLPSIVRTTFKQIYPLHSEFSRAGETDANLVTAGDGYEYLPPRETCSHDVTVEDSRPAGSSRRFHLKIWLDDRIRDNLS